MLLSATYLFSTRFPRLCDKKSQRVYASHSARLALYSGSVKSDESQQEVLDQASKQRAHYRRKLGKNAILALSHFVHLSSATSFVIT